MKKKHNEGFSLVEVLVAIVILGIFVVPTCSSLILSFQMNQKTAQMLKAQQAVSSAVEELKATGIEGTYNPDDSNLKITPLKPNGDPNCPYYNVTIEYNNKDDKNPIIIKVETVVRDKLLTGGGSQ